MGSFLVEFVVSFVQDELARWKFDLDYSGYVLEHFPGFQTETPRLAAKFAKTIDHAYERYAWMDDEAFALALSDEPRSNFSVHPSHISTTPTDGA